MVAKVVTQAPATTSGSYPPEVKAQYEQFAYPPRDPADEQRRLVISHTHWLPLMTHHCFGGRLDLRRGGRVLVAGSGTGDAEVFLGHQLAGSSAEIVALDLSATSIAIAKRRAKIRGLRNITWVEASLLDLPSLALGQFDYIACTGVLHHLDDPGAGLAALASGLAPGGAMGIMLYGGVGRTGVYQIRDVMRLINDGVEETDQRVANTRAVLGGLPHTNWFARGMDLCHDHLSMGDAGLYDLFLHSHDIGFAVDDVYDLVEGAGLGLVTFLHQHALYDDRIMIADAEVAAVVHEYPQRDRQAIAELLSGAITRHFFYCSPQPRRAGFDDPELVPTFFGTAGTEAVVAGLCRNEPVVSVGPTGLRQQIRPRGRLTADLFAAIDGRRAIGEITHHVAEVCGVAENAVRDELLHWGEVLAFSDQLLLRHESIPAFGNLDLDDAA